MWGRERNRYFYYVKGLGSGGLYALFLPLNVPTPRFYLLPCKPLGNSSNHGLRPTIFRPYKLISLWFVFKNITIDKVIKTAKRLYSAWLMGKPPMINVDRTFVLPQNKIEGRNRVACWLLLWPNFRNKITCLKNRLRNTDVRSTHHMLYHRRSWRLIARRDSRQSYRYARK